MKFLAVKIMKSGVKAHILQLCGKTAHSFSIVSRIQTLVVTNLIISGMFCVLCCLVHFICLSSHFTDKVHKLVTLCCPSTKIYCFLKCINFNFTNYHVVILLLK